MAIDVYKEWLGIPEGPRPPDHYALLRLVQFEDDPEKIRKNYKKLNTHVRKYATGTYSNESQELLNELAKAMLCLTDVERKLEYDRGLGREIDDRDPTTGRRPLTSYLVDQEVISYDQAKEVKSYAERTGLSERDAVLQMKLTDPDTATRALAAEIGRPYVDLGDMLPDDSVLDRLPRAVVKRHTCLPLFEDDGQIIVACPEESSQELEDEIRMRFDKPMRTVLAAPLAINQGIAKYYAAGLRQEIEPPPKKGAKGGAKGGGKTSASGKTVANTKAAPARKPSSSLTDEERDERKKLGIVLICGTIIVLANLDNWVLGPYVWRYFLPTWFPFLLTILVGGPVIFTLYNTHIKRPK